MSKAPVVKFLRKANKKTVYQSTKILLARGDMFPCDKKGNFLTTGADTLDVEQAADVQVQVEDNADTEDHTLVLAMIDQAKKLGIKNPHAMKEETLAKRIAEAEAAS